MTQLFMIRPDGEAIAIPCEQIIDAGHYEDYDLPDSLMPLLQRAEVTIEISFQLDNNAMAFFEKLGHDYRRWYYRERLRVPFLPRKRQ